MANQFGFQEALWLKESASYGSAETMSTGTRYQILHKPGVTLAKTLARIKTEHIRQVAGPKQEEDQLGIESVQGGFGGVVPCKGDFGILLKNALGKVTTSGPVGAVYTHTYNWNDLPFVGLSAAVNKAGITYIYDGLHFKSLKLSAKVGGPLEWSVDCLGKTERNLAEIASGSQPTLVTLLAGTPYWLFQHCAFDLDGSTDETIQEFNIDCAFEMGENEDSSYSLGSVLRQRLSRIGYGVSGTVRRRHQNDGASSLASKFYDKFLAGTTGAMVFTFANPSDADFTLVITLGVVKFDGTSPNYADKGILMEEIPFVAYDLDQSTSSIVVTDEQAGPATATGAYDGSGA